MNERDAAVVITLLAVGMAGSGTFAAPLYFTGTESNKIWLADTEGIGSPTIIHAGGPGAFGPVGIDYSEATDALFWGTGQQNELWTGSGDGSGLAHMLYENPVGDRLHDVAVDDLHARVFFTGGPVGGGLWVGPADGSGPLTSLWGGQDIMPTTLAYNSRDELVYFGGPLHSDILFGPADGSALSVLFADIANARDLAIDVEHGRIYWVDGDSLWAANLDGTGIPSVLYDSLAGNLRAIDIDVATGTLYAGEHGDIGDGEDLIWKASTDGLDPPTVLYSGDYGGLRGLTIVPAPGTLILAGAGGVSLRRRR